MPGMRDTSLLAFDEVYGMLGPKQRDVLDCFNLGQPLCDLMLANMLGWPINCVTPRRGELVRMGLLLDDGAREWQGRKRHFWTRAEGLFLSVDFQGRSVGKPVDHGDTEDTETIEREET